MTPQKSTRTPRHHDYRKAPGHQAPAPGVREREGDAPPKPHPMPKVFVLEGPLPRCPWSRKGGWESDGG
eukprot:8795325-Pyramimonas_sp.AAC.1